MRAAARKQRDAATRDEAECRYGEPGRSGREHQLEQRDRVTGALLEPTERAVAVVRGDECPFGDKGGHSNVQHPVAPAGDGAPPDVADRPEKRHRYRGVDLPERSRRR
ncbi:MAG: hypothetical protein QOE08_129 [Thermoleophilaceae bacterium]|nr:hypothetical protein [Thermoleophilaceae bacterium]